jgi:hypothetical protein
MRQRILGVVVITGATLASVAGAQNLLTNPTFNGSVTGWINGGTTLTYDAADSATADGTGSAVSGLTVAGSGANANGIEQCVTGITPGTTYSLSGSILFPSQPSAQGSAWLIVQWYAGANCTPSFITDDQTDSVPYPSSGSGVWFPEGTPVIAPAGATSARVIGEILNNVPNSTFDVNFDNFDFGVNNVIAEVPTLEPAGLATLLLTLTVAAVIAMRRRAGRQEP